MKDIARFYVKTVFMFQKRKNKQIKKIPKKFLRNSKESTPFHIFKFSSNENMKDLKFRNMCYLLSTMLYIWRKLMHGLLGLNHVIFLEKI